jgi:lambda repressor-like predicted transcriptional regulator
MKPEEIKLLLKERGATQVEIAEVVGVSQAAVSAVINGVARSRRIAMTIAHFLDKEVNELWPGRYPKAYRRRTDMQAKILEAYKKFQALPIATRATAEV